MLYDDTRVRLRLWHVVARPALSPSDKIAAKPHPPIVRVDVAVDGDDHEGAVEHVGVGGDSAVWRAQDHGLLGEIKRVPVVEHLLHAHIRRAGVCNLAGRDKSRNDLRVLLGRRSRRVAFWQLHLGDKLTHKGAPLRRGALFSKRCAELPRRGHLRLEGESLISAVNDDGVARPELAAYDAAREGVLDVASYGPRQRSPAEPRVVALLGEELLCGVGDLDLDALAFEVLVQAGEHDVHDLQYVLLREGLEDDDLIYPVEELRPESPLQSLACPPLGLTEVHAVARGEAELPRRDKVLAAHVRGHDNYRVLEVDRPALGVSEAPVVEHLQERVENVRVGLLDLVEENDRVGTTPHLLRELSSLFVADVAWRRADEAAHRVALLELGHVYPDHGVLLAEEVLGECTGELGLADSCRTEEDKAADGPLGVLYASPGAPDGLGHRPDRGLLSDDPLVQHALQAQETLGLFLDDVGRRDAGPLLQDARDILAGHLGGVGLAASGPALVLLVELGLELFDPLLEAGGRLVVLGSYGILLLAFEASYLLLDAPDIDGRHRRAEPHLGRRLVEEVDGLVGQEPVRYVTVAELGRRNDGLLRDPHPVVRLVSVPEAEEDRHRLIHRRLVD